MAFLSLETFFKQNSLIKHYSPTSADYEVAKDTYVSLPYQPSIVARPQTEDQVAAIVAHCAANNTPFVIRSGGHDVHGRSTVPDILQIDMRDINYVRVASDKTTARIGGGALHGGIVEELAKYGLVTSTGSVATVGFVGWATLGGYGPLMPTLGVGVDQITGIRFVSAEGKLVEADERFLEGFRGGGGSLGAIVEITVKVYPAQDIQAGIIIFRSGGLSATIATFFANFNALLASTTIPENLNLQPAVMHLPDVGNAFVVTFAWFGSISDQSKEWQEKISALAPSMLSTVKTTTLLGFITELTSTVPPKVYPGKTQTVNLRGLKLSNSTVQTIGKYADLKPETGTLLLLHSMHGFSAKKQPIPSVFRNREPHYVVEIVGLSGSPEGAHEGKIWADEFATALKQCDDTMEGTYLSLTPTEDVNLNKIYGDRLVMLKVLKQELDPRNVFRYTLPQLVS